jgi:hypothetical protein
VKAKVLELNAGWLATIAKTGQWAFKRADEPDWRLVREALQDGILKDIARSRGHTQWMIAEQLSVSLTIVAQWWRGEKCPTGLYRTAVERYLLEGAIPQESENPLTSTGESG